MGLKTEEKIFIANYLLDTSKDVDEVVELFGLHPSEDRQRIVSIANEYGVWKCTKCGKWTDELDLVGNSNEIICLGCQIHE